MKVTGSIPRVTWDLCLFSLHVIPVSAGLCPGSPYVCWVLSRFSSFLTQCKNMHARGIGNSELSVGVCVFVILCGQVMNCLVQVDSWERLQQTLRAGGSSYEHGWSMEVILMVSTHVKHTFLINPFCLFSGLRVWLPLPDSLSWLFLKGLRTEEVKDGLLSFLGRCFHRHDGGECKFWLTCTFISNRLNIFHATQHL